MSKSEQISLAVLLVRQGVVALVRDAAAASLVVSVGNVKLCSGSGNSVHLSGISLHFLKEVCGKHIGGHGTTIGSILLGLQMGALNGRVSGTTTLDVIDISSGATPKL